MLESSSVHELRVLVESYHPIVAIETVEEERACALARAVAREARLELFEWSITRGLTRSTGDQQIGDTREPAAALGHVESLTVSALFLLKDIGAFLSDARVARKLREVAQRFQHTRSAVLLIGTRLEFPAELQTHVVHYRMRLPDPAELEQMLGSLIESLTGVGRVALELGPDDLPPLIDALAGLTLNEARQAVARAALSDGRLNTEDLRNIREHKAEALRSGGPLEYLPLENNRFELAGFERFKAWLERARLGYSERSSPAARA